MTIQGAIAELQNLLNADDVPMYYKGGIEKVIETIATEFDKDINVRSKDEPQTNGYQTFNGTSVYVSRLEDEPQTDIHDFTDCDFCKERNCKDCEGGKDEPQTCDTCKYGEDKHRYAHICNECGVGINNYEPKDEPQTDCAWKRGGSMTFTLNLPQLIEVYLLGVATVTTILLVIQTIRK